MVANENDTPVHEKLELLMCFDSNGQHLDRKKLWKVKGSEYKRCSTLHTVSQQIKNCTYKELDYVLISVGTNDLDTKNHDQVFGEMQILVDEIRSKFHGIKLIINELLPRNDHRDNEVQKFNHVLGEYVKLHADLTVVSQQNMRDPTFSMFYDAKHMYTVRGKGKIKDHTL